MNPHFFTAPFYFTLLCFDLVQGSRFKVQGSRGGFADFLEDGILVSQHCPKGRIGHRRHEKGTAHKMRKRRGASCMMDKLFHIMGGRYMSGAPLIPSH